MGDRQLEDEEGEPEGSERDCIGDEKSTWMTGHGGQYHNLKKGTVKIII